MQAAYAIFSDNKYSRNWMALDIQSYPWEKIANKKQNMYHTQINNWRRPEKKYSVNKTVEKGRIENMQTLPIDFSPTTWIVSNITLGAPNF